MPGEKRVQEESLALLEEIGLADAAGLTGLIYLSAAELLEKPGLAAGPHLILLDEPAAGSMQPNRKC